MSIDNIEDISPRRQYTASAGQTIFDYPFPIFADTDIVVAVDGTIKVITIGYTVSGVGDDTGGSVTLTTALAGGEIVTLYRSTTIERLSDFQANGPLSSATFNDELDRITLVEQELRAADNRSLRVPTTANVADVDLSLSPSNFANMYLSFDADGKPTPAALASSTITQAVLTALRILSIGVKYPQTLAEAAVPVTPAQDYIPSHDFLAGENVIRFNGTPDGDGAGAGTDNAAAFQAAIDVAGPGGRIIIPGGGTGVYQFNSGLTMLEGQVFEGESQVAVILNFAAGVTAFDYNPTPFVEVRGQHFKGLTIQSDLCIQINRTSTTVENGVSPCVVVGGSIKNCRFYNITANTGYAVLASGIFDWAIQENKFAGTFDTVMVTHASDLNDISHNRWTAFISYGWIDRSAANFFGSSNRFHHNDMTLQENTDATFISSSSINVNIKDNYLEQIGSGSGVGISIEKNTPAGIDFGANTQSFPSVICLENNRIEPAANFAHTIRIDPTQLISLVCKNPSSPAAIGSAIFTSSTNTVPLIFNANNLGSPEIEIMGADWGEWDGFKSAGKAYSNSGGWTVDATCNKCFVNLSATGDARIRGKNIVMPTTMTSGQLLRICPNKALNTHFVAGAETTVTVVARSTHASGDTLSGGYNSSSYDSPTTNMSLTNQFQVFTFTFTVPATGASDATVSLQRSTANGEIEIASVSWKA